MKTPEQIQEYLKYITKQKEDWVRQPDASTNTNTLIAVRVAEEMESTLRWVLDLNPFDRVAEPERMGTQFLIRYLSR